MNTWDVSVVSKFLPVFTLYPLPELSLKHVQLTYKLTALTLGKDTPGLEVLKSWCI
jgi:hypothetical protein